MTKSRETRTAKPGPSPALRHPSLLRNATAAASPAWGAAGALYDSTTRFFSPPARGSLPPPPSPAAAGSAMAQPSSRASAGSSPNSTWARAVGRRLGGGWEAVGRRLQLPRGVPTSQPGPLCDKCHCTGACAGAPHLARRRARHSRLERPQLEAGRGRLPSVDGRWEEQRQLPGSGRRARRGGGGGGGRRGARLAALRRGGLGARGGRAGLAAGSGSGSDGGGLGGGGGGGWRHEGGRQRHACFGRERDEQERVGGRLCVCGPRHEHALAPAAAPQRHRQLVLLVGDLDLGGGRKGRARRKWATELKRGPAVMAGGRAGWRRGLWPCSVTIPLSIRTQYRLMISFQPAVRPRSTAAG